MKLVVPMLAEAWSGQLLASGLPFYELNRVSVPFVEILVGIALGFGLFTRPAAVMVIGIMAVATYVHIVVEDPSLFPLQPSEPIIPLAVIAICGYLLSRGGGSWSKDECPGVCWNAFLCRAYSVLNSEGRVSRSAIVGSPGACKFAVGDGGPHRAGPAQASASLSG